jgi:hypothetical protein
MILLNLSEYALNGILWLLLVNLGIYTYDKILIRLKGEK